MFSLRSLVTRRRVRLLRHYQGVQPPYRLDNEPPRPPPTVPVTSDQLFWRRWISYFLAWVEERSSRYLEGKERSYLGKIVHEIRLFYRENRDWFLWCAHPEFLNREFEKYRDPFKQRILFEFNGLESLKLWKVASDFEINGYSTASLTVNREGKLLFFGVLDTTPPRDNSGWYSGYACLKQEYRFKSFDRLHWEDFTDFNCLEMRVRGDGRMWGVQLDCLTEVDLQWDDRFNYYFSTRGGPHWQTVEVPFSKFFLTNKGWVQRRQILPNLRQVCGLSFLIADNNNGPYCLEIDWIKVTHNPAFQTEIFAYEVVGKGIGPNPY